MANTFTQIYMHIIFAVNKREAMIGEVWRDELYHYLTNEAGERLEQDAKGDYQVVAPKSEEEIAVRRSQSRYAEHATRRAQKAAKAGPVLSPKGAIILVSFNDTAFSTSGASIRDGSMKSSHCMSYSISSSSPKRIFWSSRYPLT